MSSKKNAKRRQTQKLRKKLENEGLSRSEAQKELRCASGGHNLIHRRTSYIPQLTRVKACIEKELDIVNLSTKRKKKYKSRIVSSDISNLPNYAFKQA